MFTADDEEALRVLSLCVPIASPRQIARLSSDSPTPTAVMPRLKRLQSTGLLRQAHASAVELPELVRPLVEWRPGDWVPEFGALAWILRQRWRAPPMRIVFFYATTRCAQLYGGRRTGFTAAPGHISHDLGVMEMFLATKCVSPHLIKLWIDEKRLAPFRRAQKLPDAVLATSPNSVPLRVLEFGGRYGKKRLQEFHDDCEERGLPYEIW